MSIDIEHQSLHTRNPQFAVGIGASAGGLEALELLFDGTPAIDNCAFFVVTHLSPDFKSLLDELLQRHTTMNVEIAEHGKQIRAACVYIIPPKVEMVIASGRIFLKDRDRAIAHFLGEQHFDAAFLDVHLVNETSERTADVLQARGIDFAFVCGSQLPEPVERRFPGAKVLMKPARKNDIRDMLICLGCRVST